MRGVEIGRACKYCRRRMRKIRTAAMLGGIWKKTEPAVVCPYCDLLERDA